MSKKNRDELIDLILKEASKLIDEGFNENIVKDSLDNFITEEGDEVGVEQPGSLINTTTQGANIITQFGGAGIVQFFKKNFFSFLLGKLGLDPNSYFGLALSNTFANLQVKDWGRVFDDCTFTTELIAKSLLEAFIDKFRTEAGFEGFFYGVLKETLVEAAADSNIYRGMAYKLNTVVCPLLQNVGKNFDLSPLRALEK